MTDLKMVTVRQWNVTLSNYWQDDSVSFDKILNHISPQAEIEGGTESQQISSFYFISIFTYLFILHFKED